MKFLVKKLGLVAAIALLAAACNARQPLPVPSGSWVPIQQQPTTYKYVNGSYNFEFTYPVSMFFVNPTYGSLSEQLVQLQIPQSTYPKTNFGDADFTVSETYAKNLSACLGLSTNGANPKGSGSDFQTQKIINGVIFYQDQSTGVGAGNIYSSQLYRTWISGGSCFELAETIHTGNIENYPQGTVTEVNPAPIYEQLDTLLNSFKFTK